MKIYLLTLFVFFNASCKVDHESDNNAASGDDSTLADDAPEHKSKNLPFKVRPEYGTAIEAKFPIGSGEDSDEKKSNAPTLPTYTPKNTNSSSALSLTADRWDWRPYGLPAIYDHRPLAISSATAPLGAYAGMLQLFQGRLTPLSLNYVLSCGLGDIHGSDNQSQHVTEFLHQYGVPPESSFPPYNGSTLPACPGIKSDNVKQTTGWGFLMPDLRELPPLARIKDAVRNGYLVVMSMDGTDPAWHNYVSGVYVPQITLPNTPFLSVVIVGYDGDALLVRNSWGTSWGENGYGWIKYGVAGMTKFIYMDVARTRDPVNGTNPPAPPSVPLPPPGQQPGPQPVPNPAPPPAPQPPIDNKPHVAVAAFPLGAGNVSTQSPLNLVASATDDRGLQWIQILLNGQVAMHVNAPANNQQIVLPWTNPAPNGTHTITARALDTANQLSENSMAVTIQRTAPMLPPPTFNLTKTIQKTARSVALRATMPAAYNKMRKLAPIARVEFWINGGAQKIPGNPKNLSANWPMAGVVPGTHTVQAYVCDTFGYCFGSVVRAVVKK